MLSHVLSEAVLCLGALISGADSVGSAPRVIPGELVPAAVVDLDDGGLIALGNEWVIDEGLPSAIRPTGAGEPGVVMALTMLATEDAVSRREIGRGEKLRVVAAERGFEHSIVMLLLTLNRSSRFCHGCGRLRTAQASCLQDPVAPRPEGLSDSLH
ncbi:MAG: hypothetical protein IPH13_21890 [Planctomycetes bacterium]|nr:hypothetical protein [Planctomycetota bacterium]MCC7172388.1 hypothetical protein [Planctomycetota bacterium]